MGFYQLPARERDLILGFIRSGWIHTPIHMGLGPGLLPVACKPCGGVAPRGLYHFHTAEEILSIQHKPGCMVALLIAAALSEWRASVDSLALDGAGPRAGSDELVVRFVVDHWISFRWLPSGTDERSWLAQCSHCRGLSTERCWPGLRVAEVLSIEHQPGCIRALQIAVAVAVAVAEGPLRTVGSPA